MDSTLTVAGTLLANGGITGPLKEGAGISLGTSQNNYVITGMATATVFELGASAGGVELTGVAGGTAGKMLVFIENGTANDITLKNASGSSSAGNIFRMAGGLDCVLGAGVTKAIVFVWNTAANCWREVGRTT